MCEMSTMGKPAIDYGDDEIRKEILERQRQGMWTPEQIVSLAKHFRLRPGMKLLDAGCGHDFSLRALGPYCLPGGRLIGLDRESELLVTARELSAKEGLGEFASFRVGDIFAMPFDDDSFDITLCQTVFCHLDRPEVALD